MKTALLISTYNWEAALELVFESILVQTKMPDEILIADDGSRNDTRELIESFSKKIKIPIKHNWHEDKGFRKSRILNSTLVNTTADYIIQIDGDCIMHKKFIQDHINYASRNTYLYGSRVNILPKYVDTIFNSKKILFNMLSSEIKNRTRTLNLPILSNLYKKHEGISKKLRGCNVSFWRSDFNAINGYNEDFEGWGREDSDLFLRMSNYGVKAKRLRYAGILYHIYHRASSKDNLELNNSIQEKTIQEKTIRCKNGIDQHI